MKFEFKIRLETNEPKKKGLRRLAGSSLTFEEAPPPQTAHVPAFESTQPQPQPQPVKSLRLRAGLSVRESAKLLQDKRVRKIVGETEAGFYEMYASGNYPMAELAEHVGTTDDVGVRVYAERIEDVIIREALGLKLIKNVEAPPKDEEANYAREDDERMELQTDDFIKRARRLWRQGERTGWTFRKLKNL